MEPSGPTSGIPQTTVIRPQPVSPQLQVGQRLQATVREYAAGTLLLSVGNRQLSARTSISFEPGQLLTLQVRSLGELPVLTILAAPRDTGAAMAVRMLLPRYGPTTPLLANLTQLLTTPGARLPPAVADAAHALVRNLPDSAALSTPDGIRTAIHNSGTFLEPRLALGTPAPPDGSGFDTDFKANLLRLLQQLRDWPGSRPAEPGLTPRQTPATPTVTPSAPGPAPTSATGHPGSGEPAAAPGSTLPPATLQRAIEAVSTPRLPGIAAPGTGTYSTGAASAATSAPTSPSPPLAPPLPGAVPTAQAPVQATLDLLNRLGHLRLDLLQQTEAALARVHLNQLASQPRESDHRLVEWLFDLPLRRGDAIDLWSARIRRDTDQRNEQREQPAALWQVQLAFDLPGLGPMQAQISLRGECVSTRFWAAEADTLPLLRQQLPALRLGLIAAGLQVGDIDCRHGTLSEPASPPLDPLINETA